MLAILQNGSQSVPNYLNVCVNEPCEYQQTSSLDSLLELVIEAFFLSSGAVAKQSTSALSVQVRL